jgi:hypothetical protein
MVSCVDFFCRECIFWFCVFAMLCCLIGARSVGRARFRCFSRWLMLIWCFLVHLFGRVMGFVLGFMCWYGVICKGGRFVCG